MSVHGLLSQPISFVNKFQKNYIYGPLTVGNNGMVTQFHGLKLLVFRLYPFSARRAPNFSSKTNRVDRRQTFVAGNSVDFFVKLVRCRCWCVSWRDAEHHDKLEPHSEIEVQKLIFVHSSLVIDAIVLSWFIIWTLVWFGLGLGHVFMDCAFVLFYSCRGEYLFFYPPKSFSCVHKP